MVRVDLDAFYGWELTVLAVTDPPDARAGYPRPALSVHGSNTSDDWLLQHLVGSGNLQLDQNATKYGENRVDWGHVRLPLRNCLLLRFQGYIGSCIEDTEFFYVLVISACPVRKHILRSCLPSELAVGCTSRQFVLGLRLISWILCNSCFNTCIVDDCAQRVWEFYNVFPIIQLCKCFNGYGGDHPRG